MKTPFTKRYLSLALLLMALVTAGIFACGSLNLGSSSSSSSSTTKCSTVECFLANIVVKENGSNVTTVTVKKPSVTSTTSSSPTKTPKITTINSTTFTTTTTTVTLSSLLETTDTEQFDWDFDDPTGCTPGLCFSCPKTVQCSSMVCTHGSRDGRTSGAVIQTLGFTAVPTDSTTTEDLQVEIQPIVGPADPVTGVCTDPIDDTDPSNPVIADGALVGDAIESTTTIIGPDATGGINNTSSSSSSSSSSGGSTSSSSSSSSSSGSSSGETCQGITATCSACSFQACVTMSGSTCTGARYKTTDGGSFSCSSCDNCTSAANNAVNHCVSVCF